MRLSPVSACPMASNATCVNAENSRHHEMIPDTAFEQVALEAMGHAATDDRRKTFKLKKG